jgi:hypothetical protein
MSTITEILAVSEKDIDSVKKELEVEKLRKEIEQLNNASNELTKKWYKKPQWIIALSPIVVGILTLSVAWASGFLQAQSNLNKIQEENFNRKKDSISKTIAILSYTSDSLKNLVENLTLQKMFFDSLFTDLRKENNELKMLQDTLQNTNISNNDKVEFLKNKYIDIQKRSRKIIDSLKIHLKMNEIENLGRGLPYELDPTIVRGIMMNEAEVASRRKRDSIKISFIMDEELSNLKNDSIYKH